VSSLYDPKEQLDQIAEFADAGVRRLARTGSLVGVPGAYGFKRWLYKTWGNRGNAVYTFTGSLIAIGLSGLWAYLFKEPLLFPSLGATAFIIFETPMAEVGSPRNTMIGHTVGVIAGAIALGIFGLINAPSLYVVGITPSRVAAVALAVALTGGTLRVLRSAHPPAGATTIIVASGLLATWEKMGYLLVGVALITVAGWCLNHLMGVPSPRWAAD
jgi:CBS-domain-containing membrane protein